MFGCIDPGMALFMAEAPPASPARPATVEWVALAAALLLAVTTLLVAA